MKKNKKATSILESMIVLLVIVSWILWLYNIYSNSQKISNSTKNRIEAIEIAREGIEAMKNIRDTNWLKFAWDTNNCFDTLNYDSNCVWNWGYSKISENTHYKVYKWINNKWYLEEPSISWNYEYQNSVYRDNFKIYKKDWYYTQSWTTDETIFTREIFITDKTSTWFIVHSIVWWADSSKNWAYKVELEDLLTNWKK